MNNKLSTELMHHGIIGQKWGKKNGPPYPLDSTVSTGHKIKIQKDDYGLKNLRKARTANLDKWGKSADNNILFIAGYSGSGKSTTALRMARKGRDTVIHLDGYSEPAYGGASTIRSKKFDSYLDKNVKRWREMADSQTDGSTALKRHSKEYWNIVDDFRKAIESFSKKEFKKGNRVIVEGVQMADDWLSGDKSYYRDKPIAVMNTSAIRSMKRAFERDDRGGLIKGLKSLDSVMDYLKWYSNSNKRLKELSNISGAKRNASYLDSIISRYASEIPS